MNSTMNPMDPRNMKNGLDSNNNKLKLLITEVKNLREINATQKQELEEQGGTNNLKVATLALLIALGMILSLSVNESAKYFINRAMKLDGYSSSLYIFYPLIVLVVCAFVGVKSINLIN